MPRTRALLGHKRGPSVPAGLELCPLPCWSSSITITMRSSHPHRHPDSVTLVWTPNPQELLGCQGVQRAFGAVFPPGTFFSILPGQWDGAQAPPSSPSSGCTSGQQMLAQTLAGATDKGSHYLLPAAPGPGRSASFPSVGCPSLHGQETLLRAAWRQAVHSQCQAQNPKRQQ